MTTRFRVTKIICPCCKGTGTWFDLPVGPPRRGKRFIVKCLWCDGKKRLPVDDARRFADVLYTCAIGGYAVGDHDIKDRDRMTEEAMAVFKLLGETPPWLRT